MKRHDGHAPRAAPPGSRRRVRARARADIASAFSPSGRGGLAVGFYAVRELMSRLQQADTASAQHLWLKPGSPFLVRKLMVSETGGGFDETRAVVALTTIACGLGTVVQALRSPGIGSGFLCPNLAGPNFFAASMSAAWMARGKRHGWRRRPRKDEENIGPPSHGPPFR
jgi:hypothetical protein